MSSIAAKLDRRFIKTPSSDSDSDPSQKQTISRELEHKMFKNKSKLEQESSLN